MSYFYFDNLQMKIQNNFLAIWRDYKTSYFVFQIKRGILNLLLHALIPCYQTNFKETKAGKKSYSYNHHVCNLDVETMIFEDFSIYK